MSGVTNVQVTSEEEIGTTTCEHFDSHICTPDQIAFGMAVGQIERMMGNYYLRNIGAESAELLAKPGDLAPADAAAFDG